MSEFRKGDRVRVTFEGEVSVPSSSIDGMVVVSVDSGPMRSHWVRPECVEKIEPAVEPFQPGDFVREVSSGRVFYVAKGGYAQVKPWPSSFVEFHNGDIENDLPSTTGEYEKVNYAEVPF